MSRDDVRGGDVQATGAPDDDLLARAYRELGDTAARAARGPRVLDLTRRSRRRRRQRGGAIAAAAAAALVGLVVAVPGGGGVQTVVPPATTTGPVASGAPTSGPARTADPRDPVSTQVPEQSPAMPSPSGAGPTPPGRFYVPAPNPGAVAQIAELRARGDDRAADRLAAMLAVPQAVWFRASTPAEVTAAVDRVVSAAARQGRTPVLVARNLPFRGCVPPSVTGGARTTAEYLEWVDGFVRGLGDRPAIVVLEPDSLSTIPFGTDLAGNPEACRPRDAAGAPLPGASPDERYRALNGAVDRLATLTRVRTYLDGTHSGWLHPGDAAARLVRAGVLRTRGFFLNVGAFRSTRTEAMFGGWVSSCIAFAADGGPRPGRHDLCASQYDGADPDDVRTWGRVDDWYRANLAGTRPTVRFVVDTSRNGRGPWQPPANVPPDGDAQTWCNPPGRGAGQRPTTRTGSDLADALLWIRVPGESDGECHRWGSGPVDPARGVVDPPTWEWFPHAALELAERADPAL